MELKVEVLTDVEAAQLKPYHTGECNKPGYDRKSFRVKPPEHNDRMVIAWDMEGISLSGTDNPQHPVLFGCSAHPDTPTRGWNISTREMLEYIMYIAEKYPHSIHVGFGFKYDANMIIKGLTEKQIVRLHKQGSVRFRFDEDNVWSIRWIPGKMFTVTKRWGAAAKGKSRSNSRAKTSVTIYDYSSFFGQAFLKTAEQILGSQLTADDHDVIEHGKLARGHQSWNDMPAIQHYWEREILLIKRVFEKFRSVMYDAGFPLKDWYGPGALANYINEKYNIRPHLGAAQSTTGFMPREVHVASKHAFSGGRFELFQAGRIKGPVYSIDINSAYPYALTKIPSLHPDEGKWVHVEQPQSIKQFGVYRIKFVAPKASPIDFRAMPLFWRDNRGMISYPNRVHGWYWSPEAAIVHNQSGVDVLEGWEWHSNEQIYPWDFLHEMYDTRMRIGKKSLLSMPFKLGPNSLYGKYAQTVGWNEDKMEPPKSHALPIAGWITSYCRAKLYGVMQQIPGKIVAVETDAVYTTVDPSTLNLTVGDELGQWGASQYDEMMYIQSGMYHTKSNGKWEGIHSRGINKSEYPGDVAENYLRSLVAGEPWGALTLETKPRFIGAGAAIASSVPTKEILGSWRSQTKEMTLGDTGKRVHSCNVDICEQCRRGVSPYDEPHRLFISSRSDGEKLSYPRKLPWERETEYPEIEELKRNLVIEGDMLS